MTMQTTDPKRGGSVLHSAAVQMTAVVIVLIVIILLAWRYVF